MLRRKNRPSGAAGLPGNADIKILSCATPECISGSDPRPFVKWAGGKRSLVSYIAQRVPGNFGSYYEPFVGGGAVFFGLHSRIDRAFLSDINSDLMVTYKAVARQPCELIESLKKHKTRHCREYYYRVRQSDETEDMVAVAARFIYLNSTCFNGLYRENRKGKFNVPLGSRKKPIICDPDNILRASEALKKADIACRSFDSIRPGYGDLIYCDPPYEGSFFRYSKREFTDNEHKKLRDKCLEWSEQGATVIVSNLDTPKTRTLYKNFHFSRILAPRTINGRYKVQELIISRKPGTSDGGVQVQIHPGLLS